MAIAPSNLATPQPVAIPAHPLSTPVTKTPQENKSRVLKSIEHSQKTDKSKNYRNNDRQGGTVDEFV